MGGHECPTCGKQLSSQRGMRQHHTKVHGERLPNRKCADCGEMFYDEKAQRTYCDECYSESGKHNGNWKAAKEQETCRRCDEKFEYYPSDKEGVYCSDCVKESEEFLGTPSYKGKLTRLLTTACKQCGSDVTLRTSKRQYGAGKFCSRDCLASWQSKKRRGANHPAWQGGYQSGRARSWSSRRRAALERDEHRCQNCGVTSDELGQEPDVHHIVPIREFDNPDDAHELENLITLCRDCHMAVEHGNIPLPAQGGEDNH